MATFTADDFDFENAPRFARDVVSSATFYAQGGQIPIDRYIEGDWVDDEFDDDGGYHDDGYYETTTIDVPAGHWAVFDVSDREDGIRILSDAEFRERYEAMPEEPGQEPDADDEIEINVNRRQFFRERLQPIAALRAPEPCEVEIDGQKIAVDAGDLVALVEETGTMQVIPFAEFAYGHYGRLVGDRFVAQQAGALHEQAKALVDYRRANGDATGEISAHLKDVGLLRDALEVRDPGSSHVKAGGYFLDMYLNTSEMRDLLSDEEAAALAYEPLALENHADLPEGMPVPLTTATLPSVIRETAGFDGMMMPVRQNPGFRHEATRIIARDLFRCFTETPLEQIHVAAQMGDGSVDALRAWAAANGEQARPTETVRTRAIPNYSAKVELFRVNGMELLFTEDFAGKCCYMWVDPQPILRLDLDERAPRVEALPAPDAPGL